MSRRQSKVVSFQNLQVIFVLYNTCTCVVDMRHLDSHVCVANFFSWCDPTLFVVTAVESLPDLSEDEGASRYSHSEHDAPACRIAGLSCSTAKFHLLTIIVTYVLTAVIRPSLATECNNFGLDMRCTLEFESKEFLYFN